MESVSVPELSSSLSWLSIVELSPSDQNIRNTIISSFGPQSETIEFESRAQSISSSQQNISENPVLSSNIFATGLLSSNVETTVNQNKTTLITSEVFGTYINGIYAHLAKSRTQVLSNTPTSLKTSPETVTTLTPTSTDTNNILMPSVMVSISSNNTGLNQSAILSQTSSLLLNENTVQKDTSSLIIEFYKC